jgi:hypothetical protein
MSENTTTVAESRGGQVPAPPADHENPAIIDARKTFIITLVSAALFVGAVFILIL